MKRYSILSLILVYGFLGIQCESEKQTSINNDLPALVDIVARNESELFSIPDDEYNQNLKPLPIGVFDSGIGGLTVLEEILRIDRFDNLTHKPGADGRPDFENEQFVYLGDQANMPYGNYSSEDKTDFLRELIIKDAAFLLGHRYWPGAEAATPALEKPPVKAIVIACNTATAYGLEDVREALKRWNVPIYLVGVVQAGADGAIDALANDDIKGSVGVMATMGTCSSQGYVRAVSGAAEKTSLAQPTVIQQGCLGLAGAIEGEKSYITENSQAMRAEYRGPAADNPLAPLEISLLSSYGFEKGGILGNMEDPDTWQLNSVDNYIKYHTATLVENYRRKNTDDPLSTVILGCTHFPYYRDQIVASFDRLRSLQLPDGSKPYETVIRDSLVFIDPAVYTATHLYEALTTRELLLTDNEIPVIRLDQFYISVPNESLSSVQLSQEGGFTYEYKYGRTENNFEAEYVKRIPMEIGNFTVQTRNSIQQGMPLVWESLVEYNNQLTN